MVAGLTNTITPNLNSNFRFQLSSQLVEWATRGHFRNSLDWAARSKSEGNSAATARLINSSPRT